MVSNQVQFSLAHAGPLDDLVPFAERENRLVIAYSPLAQGLLGGRYTVDNRPGGVRAVNPLFGTENLRRVAPLLDLLREVADAHDARPAQVALAWLIGLPRVVVIPGASSVEQLESQRRRGGDRAGRRRAGGPHGGGAGVRAGLGGMRTAGRRRPGAVAARPGSVRARA